MVKYNKQIEVNRQQYAAITTRLSGIVAHRFDAETKKFYIKVWFMKYASQIQSLLNQYA